MVCTQKNYRLLANMYEELIRHFLVLHNIEEVVCTDKVEHFFDRIEVGSDDSLVVYSHGMSWKKLLFDFTSDYAVCLCNMERDLYLQERGGNNDKFMFLFRD